MNIKEELKPLTNIPESDVVSRALKVEELADNEEIAKEVVKYGNVPVVYRPTKAMLKKPPEPGLLTLIENATSINEVKNLLTKGKLDYKNASKKTIVRWEKTAERVIAELSKP